MEAFYMTKSLKKIFSLLISFCLLLSIANASVLVHAENFNDGQAAQIISIEVPSNIQAYAISILPKHLNAAKKTPIEYGLGNIDISKLVLGKPFNIYAYDNEEVTNTGIYYFPVLFNGNIEATLAITKNRNGDLSSTFSKSFSSNLNKILLNNKNKKYRLFSINNELRAIDNNNALLVSNDVSEKKSIREIDANTISKINGLIDNNIKEKKYKEYNIEPLKAENNSSMNSENIIQFDPDRPTSSKYLNVPYISQIINNVSYNWCWAATCASIITYKTTYSVTASKVVEYIYKGDVDKGGTPDQDIKAYNNWHLYPYHDCWNVTWSDAIRELANGNPIHSLWYTINKSLGHSMTVRGYEYYEDTNSKVYLLIDPNIGYISVTGQTNSGDCVYVMDGNNFYRSESIRGF
jgi:hypothetical protein